MKSYLLISLSLILGFVSCTKKENVIVYPVTNIPAVSGSGRFDVGTTATNQTSVSTTDNYIDISAGNYDVAIAFPNSNFADGTYTTSDSIATNTDVIVIAQNISTGEIYLVESGKTLTVSTSISGKTGTLITLSASTAFPTSVSTDPSILVNFSVYK